METPEQARKRLQQTLQQANLAGTAAPQRHSARIAGMQPEYDGRQLPPRRPPSRLPSMNQIPIEELRALVQDLQESVSSAANRAVKLNGKNYLR